jgi:hypothetical protein
MGKDKRDKMILVLGIVVLLLLAVLGYIFLIKPAISGFVTSNQNEGARQIVSAILTQVNTNGYVALPTGNGNQTIVLVPYQQTTATK